MSATSSNLRNALIVAGAVVLIGGGSALAQAKTDSGAITPPATPPKPPATQPKQPAQAPKPATHEENQVDETGDHQVGPQDQAGDRSDAAAGDQADGAAAEKADGAAGENTDGAAGNNTDGASGD